MRGMPAHNFPKLGASTVKKIAFLFTLLATVFVGLLPAAPAQAQVNRTFVSGVGSDSNNCANVTSPCRHFANAYAVTAPGGEIFVLDPANYGAVTITHAVSIQGHGWASIAPANGGNAITINASSGDNISIHGVAIDGTGATGGTSGIVFNSGGSLTVTDCVVQNFNYTGVGTTTGNGILIQPTTSPISFAITNTVISNNGYVGIYYNPTIVTPSATGFIDHVVTTNNYKGIEIFTQLGGGPTVVAISNSIADNNGFAGIQIQNGAPALTISIDNTSVNNNGEGITATNTAIVTLGRSVITGNNGGIINTTSPNTFYSYQDNRIDNNGPMNIIGTPNSLALH
jgi:hypothetical protein